MRVSIGPHPKKITDGTVLASCSSIEDPHQSEMVPKLPPVPHCRGMALFFLTYGVRSVRNGPKSTSCTALWKNGSATHRSFWFVGEVVVDQDRLVLRQRLRQVSDLPQVLLSRRIKGGVYRQPLQNGAGGMGLGFHRPPSATRAQSRSMGTAQNAIGVCKTSLDESTHHTQIKRFSEQRSVCLPARAPKTPSK